MISGRFNFIYPIGLVLGASLALWLVWPNEDGDGYFESILQHAASDATEEVGEYLHSAESYVEFQQKTLSAKPGEDSALPIADLYFQLGGALLGRPDTDYLDAAREYLLKSIELHPTLRQGWPYFQLGRAFERYGDEDSLALAKESYGRVPLYNSGVLSLQAGYRGCLVDRRLGNSPIPSKPLYEYFRFAPADFEKDFEPFSDAVFDGGDEALYLQAHIAERGGDVEKARTLMSRYIDLKPYDPSGRFYFDRFSRRASRDIYPESGDLLRSCYAPRAYRDGQLLLVHNHHIRADLYLPHPQEAQIDIQIELENPFERHASVFITVNDRTKTLSVDRSKQASFTLSFDSLKERNLINLHALIEDGEPSSANPLWIRIRSFTARPVASEPRL